ncbi:MAG: sulfatase-like hydrolase/transferase [Pirellulaceae bacterium]
MHRVVRFSPVAGNAFGNSRALSQLGTTCLNPDEQTIAEVLKPQGYATAIFGKWHLGDRDQGCPPIMALMNTTDFPTRMICGQVTRQQNTFRGCHFSRRRSNDR